MPPRTTPGLGVSAIVSELTKTFYVAYGSVSVQLSFGSGF